MRELAIEIGVRALLFGIFVLTEFLDPFQRVIQPEEIWLYKNPLVQSDNIPTRLMFAISFLTPLAVICVVKIIRRTDKTEVKEAFLAVSLALALNGVCTNTIKLIVGRWGDELGDALHGGPRPGVRGPQKLPQHPLLLRLLGPWLHDLLPGRQAALLHGDRAGQELEAVRGHPAPLLRHHDRPVPPVRLQAPLARFLCGRRHRPHLRLHLLPAALPAPGQHRLSQTLRQPPSPGLAEEGGEARGGQRAQPASRGHHRGPRLSRTPRTLGALSAPGHHATRLLQRGPVGVPQVSCFPVADGSCPVHVTSHVLGFAEAGRGNHLRSGVEGAARVGGCSSRSCQMFAVVATFCVFVVVKHNKPSHLEDVVAVQ